MVVPVSGSQQRLLQQGSIEPTFLVRIRSQSGSLFFCTDNAIQYLGKTYQPYVSTVGTLRTSANFPDNHTTGKEFPLEFENSPIELGGTHYPHLSQTFDAFDWELADVDIDVLLTVSGTRSVSEPIAIPLVTSGVVGTPSQITREKFLLPVATRNIRLNDSLPLRLITQADFPEADRDVLNGQTYLPILVGSGIRVLARPTAAGATTTTTEQVSAGTVLKVSETTGFSAGDQIILNGFVDNPFTIGSVDAANLRFTGLSPNLSTLGQTLPIGTVVRENKTTYDYAVANHECGAIHQIFVTPRGKTEPVVISGSLFSKQTVADPKAIGGKRTDVRITELIPFGVSGGVTQQPAFSVPGGNHDHNVSASLQTSTVHFAGSVSPGTAGAANDGNEDTSFTITAGGSNDEVIYQSFSSLAGTFVEQRYFAVLQGPTVAGSIRIRRGVTIFLTISVGFGKGEFRSAPDTGGSATSTFNVIAVTPSPTSAAVYEAWKEVTLNPAISESLINLSSTNRDADVEISGADIEVGDRVEVVIDGIPVPDASGRFGDPTASGTAIQRPDAVLRWILEVALGQPGILSEQAYQAAAAEYALRDIRLRFAIQRPMKLDALFDQIADNAQSLHFWGRNGHSLHFLRNLDEVGDPVARFREDEHGVLALEAQNAFSATELRNRFTGLFDRDWTETTDRDESYRGSVLGEDLASQERYGIRTGEVNEDGTPLFFDLIPTGSGAQATMDKIVAARSTPKKLFTIETDWTYLNLEPGDVVEIQSDLLASPVVARVIEHQVDPRLFCQIVAREIGNPVSSG